MARDIYQTTVVFAQRDSTIIALDGIQVHVYRPDTTNIVDIYSSATGPTTISNPILTDSSGLVEFYVDVGEYDIRFTDTEVVPRIADHTIRWSAISGADGSLPGNKIVPGDIDLGELASSLINYLVPAGFIGCIGGSSAPTGWLICDGSAVSRTTYSGLFSAISTNYGIGDGRTTFNLPDLRGRTPIGAGTGSGLSARTLAARVGAEIHALTADEIPTSIPNNTAGWLRVGASGGSNFNVAGNNLGTITNAGGSSHNNMQPSLVLNFIIKT